MLKQTLTGLFILCYAAACFGQDVPPTEPQQPAADSTPEAKPDKDASEPVGSSNPGSSTVAVLEKGAAPTAEQLQQWVTDLVHQKFAARQAASQKLIQAGVPGMEAAAEAAQTDDLELATRCLAVLTEGLNSKTPDVRTAARSALESLAKSENKSVAQRARQGLEVPPNIAAIPNALAGRGGNVVQIRVQITNGVREISVVENGKESVIKDTNGKNISVSMTEIVNGQPKLRTVTAKDEDDLKQNHPSAHLIYQKYANGRVGRVQIGGNVQRGNLFIPQQFPARRRIINPFRAAELFDEVDKLRQQLEELNARLQKSAEAEKPDSTELKQISTEIKSTIKRLTEIKVESQRP